MMEKWDEDLSEEERTTLINEIADSIVKRGLTTPAILFLDMHKPLSFMASQGLVVASPLFAPFVGLENMQKLSRLLRERENIELLIRRIEDISVDNAAESQNQEKRER